MYKVVAFILAVGMMILASGCALVSKHTVHSTDGSKTTVGIISFDSMGDGYPMLPIYSSTELGKK